MSRSTEGVCGMKRKVVAGVRLAVLLFNVVVVSVRFPSSTVVVI